MLSANVGYGKIIENLAAYQDDVESWGYQDMAEDAFADSGSHTRLLGNLLILEPYMHTLSQGLANQGRMVPVILQKAMDPLWDYLEGKKEVCDFQDFANNLYAAALDYNVGEEITEAQAEFSRNFVDISWGKTCEWQILTWLSTLLMKWSLPVVGGWILKNLRNMNRKSIFLKWMKC